MPRLRDFTALVVAGTALSEARAHGLLSLLLSAALLVTACSSRPRWASGEDIASEHVEMLIEKGTIDTLSREALPAAIPDIPVPRRLRPCCAFGTDLKIRVGAVPVVGFRIGNMMGVDGLGPHIYDSGAFTTSTHERDQERSRENNGLIYTCRGGFIDTAHVRDYADWTLYLAAEVIRNARAGGTIQLPDEGGERRIVVEPIDPVLLDRYGLVRSGLRLAEYISFELSVWHEIATWFGWSWVSTFPEVASAFSPEDLYSNVLGTKIGLVIAHRRMTTTEHIYNRSALTWIDATIRHLEPVTREVGVDAMRAVDQLWWDSSRRLPDRDLTLRRNIDHDGPIYPWLVPAERMPASVAAACGDSEPIAVRRDRGVLDIRFADWVRLKVDVDDRLAAQAPFTTLGRQISHSDFPQILDAIRSQNRAEFGPHADRAD